MTTFSTGRAGIVALSGQWLKYLVQILTLVVFTRMLDPKDFGLVAMATAVTGIAWVVGDFGLSLAALQAKELSQDQKSTLFWANSGIGVAIGAVLAALAPVIALFYSEPRLTPIVIVIASTFVFNGVATQFRIEINRQYRFAALAGVDVIAQVIGFGAGLAVILLGGGYWGIVVSTATMTIASMILLMSRARWWPSRLRRGVPMRELFRYGGDTFAVQIVTYVASNIDSIIIGRSRGAAELGFYNRAFQIAALPIQQMAAPLTRVVLPVLSRRLEQPDAYRGLVLRIQSSLNYGLIAVLSGLAAAASPLIVLVLGPTWAASAPLLQVLALGSAFQTMGYIYYWVLLSQARTRVLFWSELFPRVIMIALMLLLVRFGAPGVAWALVVGQVLMWVVGAFYAMPRAGLPTWRMLGTGLRPLLVFGFAFGMSVLAQALAGSASWPPIGALALAFAGWLVGAALTLALPVVRRDVAALVVVVRRALRR